jgi:hypothetical protein
MRSCTIARGGRHRRDIVEGHRDWNNISTSMGTLIMNSRLAVAPTAVMVASSTPHCMTSHFRGNEEPPQRMSMSVLEPTFSKCEGPCRISSQRPLAVKSCQGFPKNITTQDRSLQVHPQFQQGRVTASWCTISWSWNVSGSACLST